MAEDLEVRTRTDSPADRSRRVRQRWLPAVARLAVWVVLAVALFAAAWREARQIAASSDGASVALQAWSVLHGNVLLRGWRTADVSFYTTEIPVYMVAEALRGLHAGVMAISEAVNYTLLVVGAAVVAKGRARGREGLVRALVAAGVMLAPSLVTAKWLLNEADHAATAIWVLLALAVLDRAGRRWHGPVLAGLILAWATVGDPLVEVIGGLPLLVAGLVRCSGLATRRVPPRERWYELSLAAAGVGSIAAAAAATRLIAAVGGWAAVTSGSRFVDAASLPHNLAMEVEYFFGLFSADFFGQKVGPGLIPVLIHLAGAAVVAVAIVAACRRFAQGGDLVADVLLAAIACNLIAYLLLYEAKTGQIREISPVLALGAALAGRVLGGPAARNRLEPVLAAGLACYLLTMGPALTGKPRPPVEQGLTEWLAAHHLTSGIAGYWQANSVTVDSGSAITVRPVKGDSAGRPVPYIWETYLPQFAPGNYADFLVLTTGITAADPTITEHGAAAAFGKPARVYRYQGYTILVWHENLLSRL